MVAIRGRTFKRPWRRSCLSSKLKSSSAPIGRKDSWCFHAVGSSNAPLLGSTAAEGLPRIGRTSIATRWRSCGLPQSASCCENFVIPPDVFGQTLKISVVHRTEAAPSQEGVVRGPYFSRNSLGLQRTRCLSEQFDQCFHAPIGQRLPMFHPLFEQLCIGGPRRYGVLDQRCAPIAAPLTIKLQVVKYQGEERIFMSTRSPTELYV